MPYFGSSGYYTGDQRDALDILVPLRPTVFHSWNGEAWILDAEAARALHNYPLDLQLQEIDLETLRRGVRGLRELVLSFAQLCDLLRATILPQIPVTTDNEGVVRIAQAEALAKSIRLLRQ